MRLASPKTWLPAYLNIKSSNHNDEPNQRAELMNQSRPTSKTFYWVAIVSLVLAIIDHSYLLHEHYALRFGQVDAKSLCNINELFSCHAVSASRFAEFLGVPMALWGITGNLVLLLLVLWHPLTDGDARASSQRNILLVAGLIAATSLVMGFISTVLISRLCPFCIVAYILSFVTLFACWKAIGRPRPGALRALTSGLTPVVVLSALAFGASFIANDQLSRTYVNRDLSTEVKELVAQWQATPAVKIEAVAPLAMGANPEKARMTIVEFADFRCPHCKHAAPVLEAFAAGNPDVRLEFETWPLDGECNRSISQANGASCLLARIVYCAQKTTGHGWKAHHYLFENQIRWVNVDAVRANLEDIAQGVDTPVDQLKACADSPEAKSMIEKQAALGTSLNLQGTPTFFVNGKQLQGGQVLKVLQAVHAVIPDQP